MSGLPALLLLITIAEAILPCPSSDWLALTDGDCYLPLATPYSSMTVDVAVQTCGIYGPDVTLPQVHYYKDQERVHVLSAGSMTWLSLRRANASSPWLWPGDEPAKYTNWNEGQPTDTEEAHCVIMIGEGYWYNIVCDDYAYVICYRPN